MLLLHVLPLVTGHHCHYRRCCCRYWLQSSSTDNHIIHWFLWLPSRRSHIWLYSAVRKLFDLPTTVNTKKACSFIKLYKHFYPCQTRRPPFHSSFQFFWTKVLTEQWRGCSWALDVVLSASASWCLLFCQKRFAPLGAAELTGYKIWGSWSPQGSWQGRHVSTNT